MGVIAVRNICVLVVLLALVAGCGSSKKATTTSGASTSPQATGPAVSEDPALAAQVPATISRIGTIEVGSDADYAPNEFLAPDKHTVVGMDPELITAVAQVLGLKAEIVNERFGAIIPKVVSGALTVGASSITDTKEREEKVDFVTYLSVGQAMMTKASGPHLTSLKEVCPHRIGVEAGTLEETRLIAQGVKCRTEGKPPLDLRLYETQEQANAALLAGGIEVDYADAPIIEYQVQRLGAAVWASPTFSVEPYGFAIAKNSGLEELMVQALKVLMKNGTYAAILKRWNLQDNAISEPVINGATH